MTPVEITLGGVIVPVYAQRHAYLTNRLGRWFEKLAMEADVTDGGEVVRWLVANAWDVLVVLIPALPKRMSPWQFKGYATAEAMEAGDYDEDADESPTTPEIIAAFETAVQVNRFDVAKVLIQLVDPQLLRQTISTWMAERILSTPPPSSPSTNGASDSTSSGTTAPVPTASVA